MRAVSAEGFGCLRFFRKVRGKPVQDRAFRQYFEGETTALPAFYQQIIQKDLGDWWAWLPAGALEHNPNAYLQKTRAALVP